MMVALPRRKAAVLVLLTQLLFATTVHTESALDGIACTTDEKEICKAGDGDCQVGASRMIEYCEDRSVHRAAVEILDRMCGENSGRACTALGLAKQKGAMGKVDEEGALRLFVKACDLECEVGCASAARLGRSWSGERFSAEKSKKYYRRACDLGSKVSCEQVHRIENAELFLPLLYGGVGTAIVLALAFFVVGKLKKRIQSRTRRVKRTITVVAVVTMCVAQLIVFLCGVVSFEMAVRTIAVGIAVGLFFFFVAGRDARTTTVHGDVQY